MNDNITNPVFYLKQKQEEFQNFIKNKILYNSCDDVSSILNIWNNNNFNGDIIKKEKWFGMDDLYSFIKNKENVIYNSSDILYELNEYGYRTSKETNDTFKSNLIACFGCSNTFGIGLPYEETWPSVLNSNLDSNWSVKNYGVSGGSMDMISRLIYNYTLSNNPKVICCFFPDMTRMELFNINCIDQYSFNHKKWQNKEIHDSYLNIMNFNFGLYSFIKNFKFIESICKTKNIKFYWFTWCEVIFNLQKNNNFNFLNKQNYLNIDDNYNFFNCEPKARDNCHYGKFIHNKIGYEFSKKIIND
jgi:hypothetical protein